MSNFALLNLNGLPVVSPSGDLIQLCFRLHPEHHRRAEEGEGGDGERRARVWGGDQTQGKKNKYINE